MICSTCTRDKAESEFRIRSGRATRQTECKKCENERAKLRRKTPGHQRATRLRQKDKAVAYLGGKCMNPGCPVREGYPIPAFAFDFHHRDPTTKTADVGLLMRTKGWGVVKAELDKCDLLCAICHRLVENGEPVPSLGPVPAHTQDTLRSGAGGDAPSCGSSGSSAVRPPSGRSRAGRSG